MIPALDWHAVAWWLGLVALGALAGTLAGFIPGLHPNTLLAVVPAWPDAAPALVAMAISHLFSSQWSGTYIGVPGDDSLGCLPMHKMVREGAGREAMRTAIDATMTGLAAGVLLILPLKWLVAEPGRLGDMPRHLIPWLAAAVLVFLLAQERHKGWSGCARALVVQVLAGALGLAAARLPLGSSHMMALLGGLFGAATLVDALMGAAAVPPQAPAETLRHRARRTLRRAALWGTVGAVWTATMPGITAATAAAATPLGARTNDTRPVIAMMAAVGAAHQVFALGGLWIQGRAATGLAIAVRSEASEPWLMGRPPAALAALLAAGLAAGLLGYALTRGAEGPALAALRRLPPRLLPGLALAGLVVATTAMGGAPALLVLACATAIGCVPIAWGVRRVQLTGALLWPLVLG